MFAFFFFASNYEKYFVKAQQVRRLIADDFRNVFESGVDVLLTPIMLTEALRMSENIYSDNDYKCRELDVFTISSNLAGKVDDSGQVD